MRGMAFVGLAMLLGLVSQASASPFVKPTGRIMLYQPADTETGSLPVLAPGSRFAVDCGGVAAHDRDVRVVLKLASQPGEHPTGYRKVLATEQRFENGALQIRMPRTPDLSHHTVDIELFVVDSRGMRSCDAGRVKIT